MKSFNSSEELDDILNGCDKYWDGVRIELYNSERVKMNIILLLVCIGVVVMIIAVVKLFRNDMKEHDEFFSSSDYKQFMQITNQQETKNDKKEI